MPGPIETVKAIRTSSKYKDGSLTRVIGRVSWAFCVRSTKSGAKFFSQSQMEAIYNVLTVEISKN